MGETGTGPPFDIVVTNTGGSNYSTRGWGDMNGTLTGTYDGTIGSQLLITGCYPEDSGTTVSTRTLTVNSATEMSGTETWQWYVNPFTICFVPTTPLSCPNGEATMTATKLP